MAHADYDGSTLRIVGHNKAAKVALAGESWESDVVLNRAEIARVESKPPSRLVNGWAKVYTVDGRTFQVHFRHKQAADLDRLVAALGA
jgi:hypothetical protein